MPESQDIDLVLATRGSQLALWQAHFVAEQLNSGGFTTSQKVIKTTGDRIQNRFLHEIGGKGLFVKEIEETLRLRVPSDVNRRGPLGVVNSSL